MKSNFLSVSVDVIKIRYEVYSKAKKWEMASEVARGKTLILPENSWGFIHYAFTLNEMKRTKEAQAVLLPVAEKFPDEHLISYNLACYCCQLGQLKEAMRWLGRAIDLSVYC
jgi:predicted Zn-dependent protease